jgi:hypothetical protein
MNLRDTSPYRVLPACNGVLELGLHQPQTAAISPSALITIALVVNAHHVQKAMQVLQLYGWPHGGAGAVAAC